MPPRLGVIGGSGLYALPGLEQVRQLQVMTAWGAPSAPLTCGRLRGIELVFLPRHGAQHHLPPHLVNYRANVAALAEIGVDAVVATAAVGGIAATAASGCIVIPHQIIDYTYGREHTFSDGTQPHPQHVDFTEPYSAPLRAQLIAAAARAAVPVLQHGVYGATQGPRLESAAEIDRMERDGCTIVGMTGMPEAALARELALAYANVSLVVNAAAGRAAGEITMADIERELAHGMVQVRAIVGAMVEILASSV